MLKNVPTLVNVHILCVPYTHLLNDISSHLSCVLSQLEVLTLDAFSLVSEQNLSLSTLVLLAQHLTGTFYVVGTSAGRIGALQFSYTCEAQEICFHHIQMYIEMERPEPLRLHIYNKGCPTVEGI